jgi:hypothetical protein
MNAVDAVALPVNWAVNLEGAKGGGLREDWMRRERSSLSRHAANCKRSVPILLRTLLQIGFCLADDYVDIAFQSGSSVSIFRYHIEIWSMKTAVPKHSIARFSKYRFLEDHTDKNYLTFHHRQNQFVASQAISNSIAMMAVNSW